MPFRPFLSAGCVVPLIRRLSRFCHAELGRVDRVWSASERSLEILPHGWELNPGHGAGRQQDTFILPLTRLLFGTIQISQVFTLICSCIIYFLRYWVSEVWVLGLGGMGTGFGRYGYWVWEVWILGFWGMDTGFRRYGYWVLGFAPPFILTCSCRCYFSGPSLLYFHPLLEEELSPLYPYHIAR